MPIGDRYKSTIAAENWDAVIIGSGISGLATERAPGRCWETSISLGKTFQIWWIHPHV
ncbi:MAG: hypothetical protein CM1200mP10_27320 [Candidatus Neomarinimicrobiota bacterium]|nr:MAG: hypothetical protein CM1200mP10_27320 [Candidatus Neomarinimicrobiota bacterium]